MTHVRKKAFFINKFKATDFDFFFRQSPNLRDIKMRSDMPHQMGHKTISDEQS